MKLHSKKEVCGMLGISPRSLDRRISNREIGIVKIGHLTKISDVELIAFIKRNSHGGVTA
jgi:hypothetical protein